MTTQLNQQTVDSLIKSLSTYHECTGWLNKSTQEATFQFEIDVPWNDRKALAKQLRKMNAVFYFSLANGVTFLFIRHIPFHYRGGTWKFARYEMDEGIYAAIASTL